MGTQGIATNCNNLKQFYFLDQATGNPIDGSFSAGPFTSEEIEFNHEGVWQIQAGASSGASGTITLQQSADGSFWDDLPNATAVPVPLNDSVTFEDDFLSGRYIRAIYAETTAGNLSLILTQKS